MKTSKFGTKNVLFGYFWTRILKNCCRIWNHHLPISVVTKFCGGTKIYKFGTKNANLTKKALFGYFWARIKKNYCQIWNQHLQVCLFAKFTKKQKCLNLGPKMPDLCIFELEFETIFSYLKSAPSNLSNCKISQKKTQKCLNLEPKMPYLGIFGLEF